jgi:hypothetical protein
MERERVSAGQLFTLFSSAFGHDCHPACARHSASPTLYALAFALSARAISHPLPYTR